MKKKIVVGIIIAVLVIFIGAVIIYSQGTFGPKVKSTNIGQAPTLEELLSETPDPTPSPEPTETPEPTEIPEPTETPEPTGIDTSWITPSGSPAAPTTTPAPTSTPTSTTTSNNNPPAPNTPKPTPAPTPVPTPPPPVIDPSQFAPGQTYTSAQRISAMFFPMNEEPTEDFFKQSGNYKGEIFGDITPSKPLTIIKILKPGYFYVNYGGRLGILVVTVK